MASTIFEKDGTHLTVKPDGWLDTATAPVLEKEIQPYLDGVQYITVDLEKVEYISSGGLRVLLEIEQVMEDRDGEMRLIHVNEHIIGVFDLVGFMDIVKVEND